MDEISQRSGLILNVYGFKITGVITWRLIIMPITWKAPDNVYELAAEVREKHHQQIANAQIGLVFVDSKPFIRNRFNWGRLTKFSEFNRIWQHGKLDICLSLCAPVWHEILNQKQREALLDLHFTRCEPDYEPETIVENGKKITVKDDFGRIKYSNVVKTDDNGDPKWLINPLDLTVFTTNVRRYGLWCEELHDLNGAMIAIDRTEYGVVTIKQAIGGE